MAKIQLFKRTAPGAAAMPRHDTGAAALWQAEQRGEVLPGEDLFERGDLAKGVLAICLFHQHEGIAAFTASGYARALDATPADIERVLRGWNEGGDFRVYRQFGGDELAVVFPDAAEQWLFGWRSIGAALSYAERNVRDGGRLSEVLDQDGIDRLRAEWGIERAAPGESGDILDVEA